MVETRRRSPRKTRGGTDDGDASEFPSHSSSGRRSQGKNNRSLSQDDYLMTTSTSLLLPPPDCNTNNGNESDVTPIKFGAAVAARGNSRRLRRDRSHSDASYFGDNDPSPPCPTNHRRMTMEEQFQAIEREAKQQQQQQQQQQSPEVLDMILEKEDLSPAPPRNHHKKAINNLGEQKRTVEEEFQSIEREAKERQKQRQTATRRSARANKGNQSEQCMNNEEEEDGGIPSINDAPPDSVEVSPAPRRGRSPTRAATTSTRGRSPTRSKSPTRNVTTSSTTSNRGRSTTRSKSPPRGTSKKKIGESTVATEARDKATTGTEDASVTTNKQPKSPSTRSRSKSPTRMSKESSTATPSAESDGNKLGENETSTAKQEEEDTTEGNKKEMNQSEKQICGSSQDERTASKLKEQQQPTQQPSEPPKSDETNEASSSLPNVPLDCSSDGWDCCFRLAALGKGSSTKKKKARKDQSPSKSPNREEKIDYDMTRKAGETSPSVESDTNKLGENETTTAKQEEEDTTKGDKEMEKSENQISGSSQDGCTASKRKQQQQPTEQPSELPKSDETKEASSPLPNVATPPSATKRKQQSQPSEEQSKVVDNGGKGSSTKKKRARKKKKARIDQPPSKSQIREEKTGYDMTRKAEAGETSPSMPQESLAVPTTTATTTDQNKVSTTLTEANTSNTQGRKKQMAPGLLGIDAPTSKNGQKTERSAGKKKNLSIQKKTVLTDQKESSSTSKVKQGKPEKVASHQQNSNQDLRGSKADEPLKTEGEKSSTSFKPEILVARPSKSSMQSHHHTMNNNNNKKKKKKPPRNELTSFIPGYTAKLQLDSSSLNSQRPGLDALRKRALVADKKAAAFVKGSLANQKQAKAILAPTTTPTTAAAASISTAATNGGKVSTSFKTGTKRSAPNHAGEKWFGMTPTPLTEEVKRDLHVIRNRGYLDPKRFYKSSDKESKFVQVGTVIEGNAEYYSSRLTKKQRRSNLMEEMMADPTTADYAKRKYRSMQQEKNAKVQKQRHHNKKKRGKRAHA